MKFRYVLPILAFGLTAQSAQAAECARDITARTKVTDLLICIVKLNAEVENMGAQLRSLRATSDEDSIPPNAVMAFDDPGGCPAGWSDFTRADGRMIIGVTQGKSRLSTRFYGEEDGEEDVALTVEEMPTHRHGLSYLALDARPHEGNGTPNSIPAAIDPKIGHNNGTHATGNSQPHNNMPPYIALYYCKKN